MGTTPTITAIDEIGWAGGVASSAKNENIQMDAIDFSEGLWLTGNTPDGTYLDFLAHDFEEGGAASNGDRIGHIAAVPDSENRTLIMYGQFTIGETDAGVDTATDFTDSLRTLLWPGGRVDAGWNSLDLELGAASTILHTSITLQGAGRDNRKHFFDSSADQVDATNNEIDITDHQFLNGDYVIYSAEGGTQITGLTDGNGYWVRAIDANTISLHTGGRLDAHNDTNQVALTAAGTGESHSLRLSPDTRYDINHRGTTGSADWESSNFVRFRDIICTSAVAFQSCVFVNGREIDLAGATMDGCQVNDMFLAEGEWGTDTNDLADISNCTFLRTAGVFQLGHAIRITVAGNYTFTGNVFTGWGPDKASFNTGTGIASNVITTDAAHGFVDGDAVYFGDEGGSQAIGLTDGDRYYVNAITTTTLSLHVTRADAVADANRVTLTAGGSETHYLYSAHAAIFNDSGGAVDIAVVGGGTVPSIRNSVGSTTTAAAAVTVSITDIIANSQLGVFQDDNTELYKLTSVHDQILL